MEKRIEFLEEMGKYYVAGIDNIEQELKELEKLGYDCYFDSNKDYIIWSDYQENNQGVWF